MSATVSSVGFAGRMGNAMCGVVFGFVIVLCSGFGIWTNEGRAVWTDGAIRQGMKSVIETKCGDPLDPSNNGLLVHASCPLSNLGSFSFVGGAVRINDVAYAETHVEMYQWIEHKLTSTTKDAIGGGSTTTSTYSYAQDWVDHPVDSSRFAPSLAKLQDGTKMQTANIHVNPSASLWPIKSEKQWAPAVRLGHYELGSLTQSITSRKSVSPPADWAVLGAVGAQPPLQFTKDNTFQNGDFLYSQPYSLPPIQNGALRVSFFSSSSHSGSVLAMQSGATFDAWRNDKIHRGYELKQFYDGTLTSTEMFAKMDSENRALTLALRFLFFLLVWAGFSAVFHPISVAPDIFPFLGPFVGDLVGFMLAIATFALAVFYCLLLGAVAWVRFRPGWALGLFVLAALGVGAYVALHQTVARRRIAYKTQH